MNLTGNITSRQRAITAIALTVACAVVSMTARSADSVEVKELKAALSMTQRQLQSERQNAAQAEAQRKALANGLAEAVRVSEEQVAAAREIQLKLQAFGIDLFTQDENSLEQRLLKAVRDLDIYEQDLERQNAALQTLSESYLGFVHSVDASEQQRATALAAIESARLAMSGSADPDQKERGDISNSRVVSIDSEIGLVVFDAGRREGLRVGTPITVLREDRPIYTAMIVDVREAVAGAVLQDKLAEAAEVAVGDGIELQPNHFNF